MAFALGGPEIIVILFLLAVPIAVVVGVLVIVKMTRGRRPPQPMAAQRLQELDELRTRKLVTEEEYERKRKEILKDM